MTKEELEKAIFEDKLSYEEIGRLEGVTGNAIKKRAKRMGIILPKKRTINPSEWKHFSHKKRADKTCVICGKSFRPKYWSNITCSKECLSKHRSIIRRKEKILWDGVEKKNMWKIDKVVDNHGYLYAMCPQHPKALKNGYIYLHRLVMENYLGRLLKEDEVIHHKDLNRKNNSIDNLMVLTQSEHTKLHHRLRNTK